MLRASAGIDGARFQRRPRTTRYGSSDACSSGWMRPARFRFGRSFIVYNLLILL
jgi:hypothetical protein